MDGKREITHEGYRSGLDWRLTKCGLWVYRRHGDDRSVSSVKEDVDCMACLACPESGAP